MIFQANFVTIFITPDAAPWLQSASGQGDRLLPV